MQENRNSILKEGTHLVTNAYEHNIRAVTEVFDIMKTALGPNSMSKMMVGMLNQ